MVDATYADFSELKRSSSKVAKRRLISKSSGAAGIAVTVVLIALKVLALADEKGWGLHLDHWQETFGQIGPGQWPALLVIFIEALVAGAAVSIVYSFTVNHITQTVQNIWQRLESVGPDPRTLLVDEDTRSWVSRLTVADLQHAQDKLLEQQHEIQRLQRERAALVADIADQKASHDVAMQELQQKNRTLAGKLDAANLLFDRFQKLAEEMKLAANN